MQSHGIEMLCITLYDISLLSGDMALKEMTKVRFISTVSKMGDRRYISIPMSYVADVEKLGDRQIRVTLDNEF